MNQDIQKIQEYYQSQRLEKELRKNRWNKAAGKPHSSFRTEDGIVLGFWNTKNGIIQIPANAKGEFDPDKALLIDKEELKAIKQALLCKPLEI